MKKILMLITIWLGFLSIEVNAVPLNYVTYKDLGITYAFIVGDYVFDLDNGFSPSLEDIMRASKSIKEGQPTSLYNVLILKDWDYFTLTEVYTDQTIFNPDQLDLRVKYVYRDNINGASTEDFDVLK